MAAATSKKFLNDGGARCVEEMLEGLVRAHPRQLARLAGLDVLVRRDFQEVKASQVVLVSGGGSGHEPAHAGFCGDGLLTAAVCGKVFSSPSVDAVLHTIRTVTGPPGCLLIVKNYTGDRLNFGLAAEQAKTEGFKVEIVFVGDDAALVGKGVTGRRGLAGTVFVHKVAGAAAAAGATLEEVAAAARAVAAKVRTVGAALSMCNVPGKALGTRLQADDGKMELGLGIHGEPGRETLDVLSSQELVSRITKIILDDFQAIDKAQPKRVAVMLNNLGGTTALEMYGLAKTLLDLAAAEPFSLVVDRIYVGPLMTSLEMQGVSISLLALDLIDGSDAASVLKRLDADATALGWQGALATFSQENLAQTELEVAVATPKAVDATTVAKCAPLSDDDAAKLGRQVRAAAEALVEAEPKLTEWDQLCGDGDAGETFEKGAKLVLAALDSGTVDLSHPHLVAGSLAEQTKQMGGTSGAVLAIFFRAIESHLIYDGDFAGAFKAGVAAISTYGGAQPGYRTMLDPLHEMSLVVADPVSLEDLVGAAQKGAEATASMNALAGRSNYIPDEKLQGVPDPGAMAVQIAMEAFAAAV